MHLYPRYADRIVQNRKARYINGRKNQDTMWKSVCEVWYNQPEKSEFVRAVMNVLSSIDEDWLLSKEAFLLYASCMYQPRYENFKKQMEELINDPSVRVYVCESQGKKTGMMVLRISDSVAEIIGIAVSEKKRRQGTGRRMIQYVMKSEGLERIDAQTDDDSIGFYRKCGFTEERIVVDYPDGSAVRYNCALNK